MRRAGQAPPGRRWQQRRIRGNTAVSLDSDSIAAKEGGPPGPRLAPGQPFASGSTPRLARGPAADEGVHPPWLTPALRPDYALVFLRDRRQSFIHELLHALAAISLGSEDVAL